MQKINLRGRWVNMLSRCEDEDNAQYKNYGQRGIFVCKAWHDFNTFYNWCVENNIEKELQVDRIDNNGPYSPQNCRLVTRKENMANKSNSRMLTAFGETKSMTQWITDERCVVDYGCLAKRIYTKKYTTEEAISTFPNYTPAKGKIAANAILYPAFGELKTVSQWVGDSRCVVGKQTLTNRIQSDWNIEKALTTQTGFQKGIKYEGHNVSHWFNDPQCRVGYGTLNKRLASGWSVKDALTVPPRASR